MELKLLTWVFIVLCWKAFSGLAHEITHTLTQAGYSEPLGQTGGEKQQPGSNVTIGFDEEHARRRYKEVKVFHLGGRRGRGNGGHGGGEINPRPSKTYAKSDASTLLARPALIISVGPLQIFIGLLIVFHISL